MYEAAFPKPTTFERFTVIDDSVISPPLTSSDFIGDMVLTSEKTIHCENLNYNEPLNRTANVTLAYGIVGTTPQPFATPIQSFAGATIVSPIILSLTGITGQIIALVYLHRPPKPRYIRSVFSILLSTLIWTDLIGKLITTPPAIISYINGKWAGGRYICHLHGYCMMLIDSVTHYLVSAMAIDRLICVRYGYFYKSKVTKSKVRILLITIWLFCLFFCALPTIGFGQYELQYPGTWCFVNIHITPATSWHHRLYTILFGIITLLNICVICTCNLMVIATLLSVRVSRKRKLSASSKKRRDSCPRELEIQMSIVLIIITIVFVSSWLPLDLRLFLNQISPHRCREEHISDLVAVRMASFNQIIDPWTYIICRKVFTSKIWKCCRSVIIGRKISLKFKRSTSVFHTRQNLENVESSKIQLRDYSIRSKNNESSSSLAKAILSSTNSLHHVNEINMKEGKLIGMLKEKVKMERSRNKYSMKICSAMNNSNVTLQSCWQRKGLDEAVASMGEYQKSSFSMIDRKQFRIPHPTKDFSRIRRSRRFSRRKWPHSYTLSACQDNTTESNSDIQGGYGCIKRRHSSGSIQAYYKVMRTRSTQTIELKEA